MTNENRGDKKTVKIANPYLMFLGDAPDQLAAKTANGVAKWRPDWCIGQFRLANCKADIGLKDLAIEEAVRLGAKTLVIGVVNSGGFLPDSWTDAICQGLAQGLDVASGLHGRLQDFPAINAAAEKHGRALHNVRHSEQAFTTGKGHKRSGKRLLTVGTDCSCGKKYTALALEKAMRERGMDADFRATGQTGVLIAERGVSLRPNQIRLHLPDPRVPKSYKGVQAPEAIDVQSPRPERPEEASLVKISHG